jgi:hypothetical protein
VLPELLNVFLHLSKQFVVDFLGSAVRLADEAGQNQL